MIAGARRGYAAPPALANGQGRCATAAAPWLRIRAWGGSARAEAAAGGYAAPPALANGQERCVTAAALAPGPARLP
ncbi:MAG: hypothetical protein ACTHJX_13770 [Terriglobales bacterium]